MTKPEDGGYGFENIAESMGFETYTFTEQDYKYFGHPDAEKGEFKIYNSFSCNI